MWIGLTWYNPNRQSRGGRWISNHPELKGKCVWLNWMIGGRRPTKADYGVKILQDNNGNTFKAYGQILNIFLEPKLPELEEIDVYELSEQEPSSMVVARP